MKDNTVLEFKINDKSSPFLENGDWSGITDPVQAIESDIRNGIIENEKQITSASSVEVRNRIIEDIFKDYLFIYNFKVVEYNNSGDYQFEYEIVF